MVIGTWLQIVYFISSYKSFLPYNESLPVPFSTLLH
jgi:hypothetical protein